MVTTPVAASGAPEPPASGPINHFGRLIGVFFSPRETFQGIAAQPSWLVPVLLMTVLGLLTAVVMNQKVDWRDVAVRCLRFWGARADSGGVDRGGRAAGRLQRDGRSGRKVRSSHGHCVARHDRRTDRDGVFDPDFVPETA